MISSALQPNTSFAGESPEQDQIIAALYAAANRRHGWDVPLNALCKRLRLWAAQIIGVDRTRGGLIFSVGGWGGPEQPEVELDYVRFYHNINPRLGPSLTLRDGDWLHCHTILDDAFVANDPFYQEFLIPHGGRYMTGTKLIDDERYTFMMGMMRGVGSQPIEPLELPLLEAIRFHAREALRNHLDLREQFAEKEMAQALFEQFAYPMLVVDESRGIWHANSLARDLLDTREMLMEENGILVCNSATANNTLTEAIRRLQLGTKIAGDLRRRAVMVQGMGGRTLRLFVSALRPEQSMNMFGVMPRALIMVHDSAQASGDLDPLLVAECFSLTPAEARVAVKIAAGMSAKDIADVHGTTEMTVRTQLKHVLAKTELSRQSDLVRLLLSMPLRTPASARAAVNKKIARIQP